MINKRTGEIMDRTKAASGWKRILIGVFLPIALILVAIYEYLDGNSLECPFYRLTGLFCPGCGSGRAVQALLHGNLPQSFLYNPLLYLLGIPAAFCVVHEYIRIVFSCTKLKPITPSRSVCLVCTILVFGFWILRNLPLFSFLTPTP